MRIIASMMMHFGFFLSLLTSAFCAPGLNEATWMPQRQCEELHPYLGKLETAWEWQGAIRAELARSMEQFPAIKEDEDVWQHLVIQLNGSFDDKRLLILDNRIFVKANFLEYIKNRMHASMFVSLTERYVLKNEVMLHAQSSMGTAIRHKRHLLPTTVIAKKSYSVPGILVPNSFFGNGKFFTKWRDECDEFEEARRKNPWNQRNPRVFWRGEIMGELGHGDPNGTIFGLDALCTRDIGNYERLSAAALTVQRPDIFDVKCNKCHPRTAEVVCPDMPYDAAMRRAVVNSSLILDQTFVEQPDYARYQYVLNLPGKTAGSYSRNLNHLWFLGSIIALWDSSAVEFYYPPLKHGITHISVNRTNVMGVLDLVRKNKQVQQLLIRNAHRVGRELVCPQCLANYLLDVLDAYRLRFNHGAILDDPVRAADLIRRYLRCDNKHNVFYEVSFVYAAHIKGERELGERRITCDELYAAAAGIKTSSKNKKKAKLHPPLSQTEKELRKERRKNKAVLKEQKKRLKRQQPQHSADTRQQAQKRSTKKRTHQ